MTKEAFTTHDHDVKVLLIGIHAPYNITENIESYHQEFKSLCTTLGIENYHFITTKLRKVEGKYFFTKGKLEELKALYDRIGAQEVVISEILTPQQERNLKDYFGCRVFDRTRLILSIFEQAAISAEGKLQVEIAGLEYQKTRLAGHGVHLSQQAGMIGVKGPGETLKEQVTRHLNKNIVKLRKRLVQLEKTRATQRKRRLTNNVPLISLVGYTNAGKSSIINALTHSDVLTEDKLFATLDTTTRKLFINHEQIGLISDTVGFIQQLPHLLIEAFKSTLTELDFSDLLLHVVDISDNNWKSHINVVLETLEELGVEKHLLTVFNKTDLLEEDELKKRLEEFGLFSAYVTTTTTTPDGLDSLKEYLLEWHNKRKS